MWFNRHAWNAHRAPGCVLHDLANPLEMLRGHSWRAEVSWGRPRTRVLGAACCSAKQKALPDCGVASVPSSVTGPVYLAVPTRGADEAVVPRTQPAVQMVGSLPLAGSRNLLSLTSSLSSTGPAVVSSSKMLSKWASERPRWNLPFLFAHVSFRYRPALTCGAILQQACRDGRERVVIAVHAAYKTSTCVILSWSRGRRGTERSSSLL